MRDLQELKWHVSYEGRNLRRHKDTVRTTGITNQLIVILSIVFTVAEKNEDLKKRVKYLNEQM